MESIYQKLVHGQSAYEDYFVVNWCFFSICNFSCSYCPTMLHDGKKRGLKINDVKEFCLKVIDSKPNQKVFFEFTGGEITYYKDFSELFAFLKKHGAATGLISNGSRDIEFWKQHKDLIDHICLSFHPEQGDIAHFFEVVKLLNYESTVHVNIMMLPGKFEELYGLATKIAAEIEGVSVAIQALFQDMSGKMFDYTPEQREMLNLQNFPWGQNILHRQSPKKTRKVYRGEMKKVFSDGSSEIVNTPELIAKRENNWKGWNCFIGLENLVIDFDGMIRRGWCGVGGIIGSITDPDFVFPNKPIVCNSNNCFCGLDIMSTKLKPTNR